MEAQRAPCTPSVHDLALAPEKRVDALVGRPPDPAGAVGTNPVRRGWPLRLGAARHGVTRAFEMKNAVACTAACARRVHHADLAGSTPVVGEGGYRGRARDDTCRALAPLCGAALYRP